MPKIKDLGIKVIPETMKPPEIGGGGGCSDCTQQAFSICGTTPGGGACGNFTCTDCTFQQCSIAGGVTGGCSDCTFRQCSLVGGFTCTDCTFQQCSIAGGVTQQGCGNPWTLCLCTFRTVVCGPSVACRLQTHCGAFSGWGGCGPASPVCGGSIIDTTVVQPPQTITRDQIATLKDSLRKQIAALEEHEKNLGPKTLEEIDAREKALNDELAQLKERRKGLK